MQWLAPQLIGHGFHYFWVAVSHVENTESAQAIDILAAVDVAVTGWTGIGPFNNRRGLFCRSSFAVLEKTGVDMVAKGGNGFTGDPRSIYRRDLCFGY